MICPTCGTRYPRGVSRCAQCDVRLVEEPGAATAAPGAAVDGGAVQFCPECGAEYRQGVAECSDCEVPLSSEPPPEPPHPEPDLVKLTEISEPSLLPVVVSLLRSAGIEPVVGGEEVMGLWPVGKAVAGWTGRGIGLSAVVLVPADRAEEARTLLTEVEELSDGEEE